MSEIDENIESEILFDVDSIVEKFKFVKVAQTDVSKIFRISKGNNTIELYYSLGICCIDWIAEDNTIIHIANKYKIENPMQLEYLISKSHVYEGFL